MSIIQRYIANHVLTSTAFVFLVVLALSFIFSLLKELHDIGVGEYDFWQAVIYALFLLPHTIYAFFPMLILLGGVLGLGMLSSAHELIVMRASGVSIMRIIGGVISAALLVIVLSTLIGELLAPRLDYLAENRKLNAQTLGQAVATASGVWIHDGNNFLHIEQVVGPHHLEKVTRYEFDAEHRLLAAYYAKSLDFEHGRWVLHDLVKTTLSKDHTKSQPFPLATWKLTITPNLINVGLVEPEAMSLYKLSTYVKYLKQNHLQASSYQLEFWKRVFQPLTTLVMILLAVPFVFTSPRSVSMGKRILFAVMIGFVFYVLNAIFGQFSIVFQFPPIIAALLPAFLFAMLGALWMWRARVH